MKIVLIIFLIISLNSFAFEEIKIISQENPLTQGQITQVIMGIQKRSLLIGDIEKMKGAKIEDTIYILDIKDGVEQNDLITFKAKIIFIKSPAQNSLRTSINGKEVQFSWDNLSVTAASEAKGYLWGDYELNPDRKLLLVISIILLLGIVLGLYFIKRRKNHASKKITEVKNIRLMIDQVKNYEEIINLWNIRDRLLACFPMMETDFRELEKDLFKYIFKPSQSQTEKEEAYNSFKKFRNKFKESTHGV